MTVEACPDIEAADRELLSDLGARLGRGEMIGGTAYAVKCWHALARLEALQRSPETSLQNMRYYVASTPRPGRTSPSTMSETSNVVMHDRASPD